MLGLLFALSLCILQRKQLGNHRSHRMPNRLLPPFSI